MNRTGWMACLVVLALVPVACKRTTPEATSPAASASPAQAAKPAYSDQDISDAWIYLLGRLLVLRLERNAPHLPPDGLKRGDRLALDMQRLAGSSYIHIGRGVTEAVGAVLHLDRRK
jgi:hypothetical protein